MSSNHLKKRDTSLLENVFIHSVHRPLCSSYCETVIKKRIYKISDLIKVIVAGFNIIAYTYLHKFVPP